jgi:hypothetical protein
VETLLDLARLRLAAALLGVRAIVRRENDVVLRTARPADLQRNLSGVKGTVRLVGGPDDHGFVEIYFRPPPQWLEPATLLRVLLKRLQG